MDSDLATAADYEAQGLGELARKANIIRSGQNKELQDAFQSENRLWARDDIIVASAVAECQDTRRKADNDFELSWLSQTITREALVYRCFKLRYQIALHGIQIRIDMHI